MKLRLHNKVAGSELTLPVCAVIAVTMWWLPERILSLHSFLGLVLCLLTTYVIMETNAQQHVIRIRTRMMSCVWLVLAASFPFMHPLEEPVIAAAFLCASYYLLFRCYQRHHPQADVFHAFLMLGVGSFFAPVMLPMAVVFFLYIAVFLRSLTRKAFWAGVLGLIVPYWCYAAWCFVTKDMQSFVDHLPFSIYNLPLPLWERMWEEKLSFFLLLGGDARVKLQSVAVIALLSIVSIVHYLRTNYDDKIRVRMILYIYMLQTLLLMAFLPVQPAHYKTTMALLVASASPLIAHYFALSKGIWGTVFFLLSLLLTAGMAAINLWPADIILYPLW